MSTETPYPNPFEILRYLLRSFDLKQSNKKLDDLARKKIYDPRELITAIEEGILGIGEKYLGRMTSLLISRSLSIFFKSYLNDIVGKIGADGVNRKLILELLISTTIKDHLVGLMKKFSQEVGGPSPNFWFSNVESLVDALFNWLSEHEPQWDSYLLYLSKERRDMISSWGKGNELPSAQSILLLSQPDKKIDVNHFSLNWKKINSLIFISRALDYIKKDQLGLLLIEEVRLALWGVETTTSLQLSIKRMQATAIRKIGAGADLIYRLQHGLKRTIHKSNPDEFKEIINHVRVLIQETEYLQSTKYWIDWHDARWHVYAGELQRANKLYKSAFENSLFLAGDNQKLIIEEALVVAASQKRPDLVFLKQLKWGLINLGYDLASVTNTQQSQKVTDTIEDWEITLWRANLSSVFPKTGLFPGIEYDLNNLEIGPLLFSDINVIKPDYRNPDRRIKIGDTWQRVMPQLVWFALIENFEVCKKLIEKGANVNVTSDVGDTPILMALESLNVTEVNETNIASGDGVYRTLDDRVFNLLKDIPHNSATMNTRTQKKRLLPIISAVESGRIDVVQAILDMGADPNGRGKTDEQTALNICLKIIGILKNDERFKINKTLIPITDEVLDAIRRQANGLSGFTLEDQYRNLMKNRNNPYFNIVSNALIDLFCSNIKKHMTIHGMREIAKLLISYGADVNAEHASPIKGYTPLMLAAELDERMLFEAMLVSGGDINKTYQDPVTKEDISILNIAKHFNSVNVLMVINDISHYISVR